MSQGGITAIDLSPTNEDIIASAGRDHTVQIYDRCASHSTPLHTLHTVWHVLYLHVTYSALYVVCTSMLVH